MNQGRALREAFAAGRLVVSVGVYDALTALIVAQAGLPSLYLTGYGAAASLLGLPDIGLLTQTEMVGHVRRLVAAISAGPAGPAPCAVIADADTGYGGPANVFRTVREYEAAGADVIQLEDQVWPKRCGHMAGKRLVPAEEMVGRLRAALAARRDPDTLILARTDALAGEGFEPALERAKLYAQAGADLLFVEAPRSLEELAAIPKAIKKPCLANMVEGGKTPFLPAGELAKLGYAVAIYPISLLLAAARTAAEVAAAFARDGTSATSGRGMLSFDEFNRLIGVQDYLDLDKV